MTRVRRLFFIALALLGACVSLPSSPAYADDDAGAYIEHVAQQALAIISNQSFGKDQKQAGLEKLFNDNVDFPWVGRFVMGRFWREAGDAQKARYLPAYQKFLTMHYTSRFTEYTSGTFKVTGSKSDGENEFMVSMQIQATDGQSQPVLVDYRVRKGADGSFKIFDVIVEGVSMITTQRSEFATVIGNNGVDYLIDQLIAKSKTGDINMGSGQ